MGRSIATIVIVASLLTGAFGYALGARHQLAPVPALAADDCQSFPETGKQACGRFLQYWRDHGGLAQQGYPITNAFNEVSAVNGQTYQVQYFERAVFEFHPENAPPYDVLLSLLGREKLQAKYPGGDPSGTTAPPPPPTAFPRTAPGGGFTLTAHQVQDNVPGSQFLKPKAGNRFFAVDTTIRNTGSAAVHVNRYYFRLRTSDGRDYTFGTAPGPDPQVGLLDLGPS